jgi:hypothetical protein
MPFFAASSRSTRLALRAFASPYRTSAGSKNACAIWNFVIHYVSYILTQHRGKVRQPCRRAYGLGGLV